MKHSALLASILAVFAVNQAQAADYTDTARVVNVTPRMETYNVPHQECADAPAATGDRNVSGSIIGGIAGAILGAQVGKGNGRVAAAAIGAGTGAVVGDRMQNGSAQQPGQRCTTVYEQQQRPSGYMVTYQYQGQTLTDFMANDPGQSVRVRVHVQATN